MHVIATAGHVDHGKSTLVRALTGSDPDRLEEEHRRGLSIELGYVWTELPPVGDVAFVDVPGHERFISTMLAGVGPVPAVLFVVAADDPWMPQAAEHLAALDALGVEHGVVAVSRSDLADPAPGCGQGGGRARPDLPARERRSSRSAGTQAPGSTSSAPCSCRWSRRSRRPTRPPTCGCGWTGGSRSREPGRWSRARFPRAPSGSATPSPPGPRTYRVRGVQSLGRPREAVTGVARVALNLAGDDLDDLDRGSVLTTPDAWHHTDVLDVRVTTTGPGAGSLLPERPLLHIGAASVSAHCRPLSDDLVRLRLDRPLPLRIGDRALLRDPGSRQIWGAAVLDPAPPPLRRRGAATLRAKALAGAGQGDLADEVARRGLVTIEQLRRIGVVVGPEAVGNAAAVLADGWLMSQERAEAVVVEVSRAVAEHERASPLAQGVPLAVLAERLGLPSVELVRAVVRPPLRVESGRVTSGRGAVLPEGLRRAVDAVRQDLEAEPFAAPTADRLRELGLDNAGAAAAAKAGLLLRPAPGVVLLPGADRLAADWLAELPQPFTTSEARVRLGTSRRVVLPLLAYLDRAGLTRRLPDDRREVTRG